MVSYAAMIRPVSTAARPAELLRASSDQIRRVADLLSQITEEMNPELGPRLEAVPIESDPGIRTEASREMTIQQAQRSFVAAMKLAQLEERPDRAS